MMIPANSPAGLERAHKLLDDLDQGKAWTVAVKPYRKKRSNSQNAYYWAALVNEIALETGHDANEVHEFLLGECFGWQESEVFGRRKVRPSRTSSQLNVNQFSSYCQWVQAWASKNLGMVLEDPPEGWS
jgi:hypothetical protein